MGTTTDHAADETERVLLQIAAARQELTLVLRQLPDRERDREVRKLAVALVAAMAEHSDYVLTFRWEVRS